MGMTSHVIRLLGLVSFASMASMRMCDPKLVQWVDDFDVSQGQASIATGIAVLCFFVAKQSNRLVD